MFIGVDLRVVAIHELTAAGLARPWHEADSEWGSCRLGRDGDS